VGWDVVQLGFIICPLAIGAAIMRFGLFDIEVIVKRSLLYGSMTACLIGVSVGALQALNHWFPHRPEWVTLAAGAFVVLLLLPLRASLQRWATHMVYGARDDPYQVVSQLSRLDAAADPYAALRTVVETLARTLRLSFVAVELATGPNLYDTAAITGAPRATPSIIPLDPSGRLLLEVMPGREPFGPADSRLLEDVARQVGRVADLVLLNSALRESRARIVSAREEERRRLQRDLHDGIGPSLAAQAMQLEVIRTLIRSDPADAEAALTHLAGESRAMVAEVRRVVDDLRPRALDQFGLVSALRQRCQTFQTRDGLALVELRLKGALPELPAAVEVAAFRIATEALTNASRHAHATHCRIELDHEDSALSVVIRDNGTGLRPGFTPGVGMTSMRARAVELGGAFSAGTDPSGGAVVSACLPLINRPEEEARG
jgi:two-component system, NarL family, sensor kinase